MKDFRKQVSKVTGIPENEVVDAKLQYHDSSRAEMQYDGSVRIFYGPVNLELIVTTSAKTLDHQPKLKDGTSAIFVSGVHPCYNNGIKLTEVTYICVTHKQTRKLLNTAGRTYA